MVEDGQTVLIYSPERRGVEPFADVIVDLHERGALASLLTAEPARLQAAISLGEEWLGTDSNILKCLRLGVALHHGALPTAYRKEIERLLRDGVLKVKQLISNLGVRIRRTTASVPFTGWPIRIRTSILLI